MSTGTQPEPESFNRTTPSLHWPSDNNLLGQSDGCLCPFATVSISVYDIFIVACFLYLPCEPAPGGVWVCILLSPQIQPNILSFSNNPFLIPILTTSLIFSCLCFPWLSHLLKHVGLVTNILICAALYSLLRFWFLNLECYNSYTSFYICKD